jgi:hypothetical protein
VTIQSPFFPTGATLTNRDAQGNIFQIAQVQAGDFTADPNDSTKYTFKAMLGTGTWSGVTLKVNAHRDADSGGNPAADATGSVTGLTITKQP